MFLLRDKLFTQGKNNFKKNETILRDTSRVFVAFCVSYFAACIDMKFEHELQQV